MIICFFYQRMHPKTYKSYREDLKRSKVKQIEQKNRKNPSLRILLDKYFRLISENKVECRFCPNLRILRINRCSDVVKHLKVWMDFGIGRCVCLKLLYPVSKKCDLSRLIWDIPYCIWTIQIKSSQPDATLITIFWHGIHLKFGSKNGIFNQISFSEYTYWRIQ